MRHIVRHIKKSELRIKALEDRVADLEARTPWPNLIASSPATPTPAITFTGSPQQAQPLIPPIVSNPHQVPGYTQYGSHRYGYRPADDDDDGTAGVPAKV